MARKIADAFTRAYNFVGDYSALDPDDHLIVTTWAAGTWFFSASVTWPYTYPILYVTGPAGGGKSRLGMDVLGAICRDHRNATGATGPTLFRMVGTFDPESGIIENNGSTIVMDEADAVMNGAKNEELRLSFNVCYKQSGSTIERSMGKTTISFPCFSPHAMLGIENGHMPETVLSRSIRIELRKRTADELGALGIKDWEPWIADPEGDAIRADLLDFVQKYPTVMRDYSPAKPEGLSGRGWEIGRTLLQIGHAVGNEKEVREAMLRVFSRAPKSGPEALFTAIHDLFVGHKLKVLTGNQILDHLTREGIAVPGQSLKGLATVLGEHGLPAPRNVRLPDGHPGIPKVALRQSKRGKESGKQEPSPVQRSYNMVDFDRNFGKFVEGYLEADNGQ